MFPRMLLVGSGALALSAVLIGSATAKVTGNVSCMLTGSAAISPGLPLNSPGNATKKFKTTVKFSGTLSNCTGTQTGTKKGAQIDGGTVVATAKTTTPVGQALPSCAGLTAPATATVLKATVKFTNSGKSLTSSKAHLTVGPAMVGTTVSFPAAGPVSGGAAFKGLTLTAIAILDNNATDFVTLCNAPGGLTTLSFTGTQGESTLVSSGPLACDAITTAALGLPNLKISTAQTTAAKTNGASPSDNYPAHCRVRGTINERTGSDGKPYAIGFELRMPTAWNGKFFFQGGMGNEGKINPALGIRSFAGPTSNALSQGYAVTTTDGGHTSEATPPFTGGALFGLDPQARVDYGYNAVSTLTPLAKQIVNTHYAAPVQRSYFVGCSDGGRQALVAAARLGDQFDGIVAVAPGFDLPKAAIQTAWDTQQFLSVSPDNPADAFTIAEMNLVGQRILATCDALDGARDGIVSDLAACQGAFELATDVPTCAGARDGSCLSAAQKTALQNVMNGPSNSSGQALYSTWPWDAGIASSASGFASWRAWKLENPILGGLPIIATLGGSALPYIFTTPPVDLTRDPAGVLPALFGFLAGYNFDTDAPKIFATSGAYTESAMSFMTPPNPTSLATFKARGKLIIYHGGADPLYSVNDTIRWYNELSVANANTPNFARLFVVPGMGHCDGGMATDKFDLVTALEDWVEKGMAPDVVVAGVTAGNSDIPADWSASRTRPLCAYPKRALLNAGATNLESASGFSCR